MTEHMAQGKRRDYFAEMYVAGMLADAGWNVYFPKRDIGFDFIITKEIHGEVVLRPVQVKGKYPERRKTDKPTYGFVGKLSQRHKQMVLAIPLFPLEKSAKSPLSVAFMPISQIKKHSRGIRCMPALFRAGQPTPRRDYQRFFDEKGMKLMEKRKWCNQKIGNATST